MDGFDATAHDPVTEVLIDYAQLAQTTTPPPMEEYAFSEWIQREKRKHMATIPINDNLFSLMVTVQADLSEQQREKLTTHMSLRGITLQGYTFEQIRECMIELFCAPRSSLENPSYRVSGQGRTFAVLDYGELEGSHGYWAECEETGEEGFLPDFEEVFWVYDDDQCYWSSRPTPFRNMKKGKGKGKKGKSKGKGKGKGAKGRRFLKPLGKQKGEAHWGDDKGKGKGKKGGKGKSDFPQNTWQKGDPGKGPHANATGGSGATQPTGTEAPQQEQQQQQQQ